MTQEEKQILFTDLCARLPYGVICVGITYDLDDDGERYIPVKVRNTLTGIDNYTLETASVKLDLISSCKLETIKPYLRTMDSMTIDESKEYRSLLTIYNCGGQTTYWDNYKSIDWLNKHHFDFRHLIPMGLAHEAKDGMYKQS